MPWHRCLQCFAPAASQPSATLQGPWAVPLWCGPASAAWCPVTTWPRVISGSGCHRSLMHCAGYQVISETPAPTAAPSPPPAPGPVYAPPPMASATTNSTPATPNNPDVDLNIAMRIFGSQVVPFTASAQFVAASALAGG